MEEDVNWIKYRDEVCYPVERYLIGFTVLNKERLIGAIISNAFCNEKVEFEQLKGIPADTSLETMGDFVLDFVTFDNFALTGHHTSKQIDDFRQLYGNNKMLHRFSKDCLHLQNYIMWGPDERKQKIWDYQTTEILADRFEMLIGVIYLEQRIDGVKDFLKKHDFFQRMDKIKESTMNISAINIDSPHY
jgi:dsRNA-specific ribonuclease